MKGIMMSAHMPLVRGGEAIKSYTTNLEDYSQTILANGGYWSANASLSLRRKDAEEWFASGLMRDVRIYNASGVLRFKGFVNKVEISIGSLSAVRGPALEIVNKARLGYSSIDTSISPPVMGVRIFTDWQSDTESQGRYGIMEKILSTGGVTETNAEYIVTTFLKERRLPRTSETINLGGNGGATVKIEILGYIHLLKTYSYNSTSTGLGNLSTKMTSILAAEPNGYFSGHSIATNTQQVALWEDENQLAWNLVWSLVEKGDSNGNRYILGMYTENQSIRYEPIGTEVSYLHRLSQSSQITTLAGVPLSPLDILPGKWLRVPDFLVGRTQDVTDPLQDPRLIFIESVTYSAPNTLQIQAGNISKLQNLLGNFGVSGIGA